MNDHELQHVHRLLNQKFSEPSHLLQELHRANQAPHMRHPPLTLEGVTIDYLVALSLAQGPHTSRVLRTLFGLVPGLMGR